MSETIVCVTPSDQPFELATKRATLKALGLSAIDKRGRKVFRKEVIYPGHFLKRDATTGKTEVEFDVTQSMIKNWVKQHDKLRKNGIDVPLPLQHSMDPEDRRGTVLRLAREFNSDRGVDSLYMYVRFRDKKSEKLAGTTQVSLFSPPDFVDGKGNEYHRPIRHVALTDYPVISGLDDFKIIAASYGGNFNTSKETEEMTTLAKVSKKLGIRSLPSADALSLSNGLIRKFNSQGKRLHRAESELIALKLSLEDDEEIEDDLDLEDDEDDDEEGLSLDLNEEQLTALIMKLIKKAMGKGDDLGLEEAEEDEEDDDDMDLEEDEEDDDDMDLEEDEEDEDDVELEEGEDDDEEMAFSFRTDTKRNRRRRTIRHKARRKQSLALSSDVIEMLVSGREAKLEGLVNQAKITPARARKLRKEFCSVGALQLSLDAGGKADPFDAVCLALEDNKALRLGEQTGGQSNAAHESNPLLADANRRAKEARGGE